MFVCMLSNALDSMPHRHLQDGIRANIQALDRMRKSPATAYHSISAVSLLVAESLIAAGPGYGSDWPHTSSKEGNAAVGDRLNP